MPSIRRRDKRRPDYVELTTSRLYELATGWPLLPKGGFDDDIEAFKAAWEQVRDDMLAEFTRDKPGRRPFAWWAIDHGIERPIIRTCRDIDCIRREHTRYGYFASRILLLAPLIGQPGSKPTWGYLQEPEQDYLQRHGLLELGEMERAEELEDRRHAELEKYRPPRHG